MNGALVVAIVLAAAGTGFLLLSRLDWRVYPIDDGTSSYRYDLQFYALVSYAIAIMLMVSLGVGALLDLIL